MPFLFVSACPVVPAFIGLQVGITKGIKKVKSAQGMLVPPPLLAWRVPDCLHCSGGNSGLTVALTEGLGEVLGKALPSNSFWLSQCSLPCFFQKRSDFLSVAPLDIKGENKPGVLVWNCLPQDQSSLSHCSVLKSSSWSVSCSSAGVWIMRNTKLFCWVLCSTSLPLEPLVWSSWHSEQKLSAHLPPFGDRAPVLQEKWDHSIGLNWGAWWKPYLIIALGIISNKI